MLIEVNVNKDNLKKKLYLKKVLDYGKKNIFLVVIILLCILIVFNLVIYNRGLNNVNSKDMFIVNRLSFNSIIIGILMGFFLALFGEVWYRKKIVNDKNRETVKNYARIFKADIERSIRLFKNKRFELIKISNVTIVKNWLQGFGYISIEFNKEEIQEFINYYSRINKLMEYEERINQHLEGMQYANLKDYPYMKEYKDLIAMFSFEINNLFKVDISKVRERLNILCK
ncbi:hypothetical protein [Clostridium sp.]|jgi:hypothetical protein|uniref:hypothetical protein n=1 Tax=Clostridium sp. TaxID=1506 RepID=UPI002589A808|nr:hypothetical protein [Clostridium sp.]MDF2504810.1 hypothetical protein [Clostridium sp.]